MRARILTGLKGRPYTRSPCSLFGSLALEIPPVIPVLTWLSADQTRYLAISEGALLAVALLAVLAALLPSLDARLSSRRGAVLFLLLVFFALIASRWPTFPVLTVFSHDEESYIAEAKTALHFPIPWVDFDNQTGGPLTVFQLVLPALLGAQLNFFTCRVVAVVLEFGALAALYGAAALCFDASIARLAVVPPLIFLAITEREPFVHLGNEPLPIFLSSVMIALICRAWRRGYPPLLYLAIGIIAGMLPFAKLQSVPIDGAILSVAAVALLASKDLPLRARFARLGILAGGTLVVPLLIVGAVALAGGFRDFWISYISNALVYMESDKPPLVYVTQNEDFGPFFDWLGAVALGGGAIVALRFTRIPAAMRCAYIAALVILVATIDAIEAPGRPDPNYLLFAVIPITALAIAGLAAILWLIAGDSRVGRRRGLVAALFVVTCLIVQHALVRPNYDWLARGYAGYQHGLDPNPIVASITANLKPGERLAIWGYRPVYWVNTPTIMGTRDITTFWQHFPYYNPNGDYFRARYVEDMTQNRPEGFLDAGPDSWADNGGMQGGYETFPALADVVNRDYVLKTSWDRNRFFVRRDLAARQLP